MDLKNKEIISNEEIFDELPFNSVNNEIISPQESLTEEIFDELPFESPVNNNIIFQEKSTEDKELTNNKLEKTITNNNVMIVDDRVKEIPVKEDNVELKLDNGILILDDRIKDIKPNHKKNSKFFKHPTIIFPIIAFVFVSILGMYLFVNNSMADTINLIKVEEKGKIGYIDSDGTIITRCKYIAGTNYYKGHAIVKNNNNLYGVLNSKGVLEVAFGNFYYIGLFGDNYIASKITNKGLKQGMLDNKLSNVTSFKYDSISYAEDGIYLFTRDETMGILNSEGKEIYSFKVDEVDDRKIDIEISKVKDAVSLEEVYAKVKVNSSSTIINVGTGKEVFSYTLSDINVLDNNVFYIKSEDPLENNTYIVISNNDIKLKTNKYKRVRIDDYKSNIAIGINDDTSTDFINLDNQKVMNENQNNDYYYGDGLVLEKTHNFQTNNDIYNIISHQKIKGSFYEYTPVDNIFVNGFLMVKINNEKYNYVKSDGSLLTDKEYDHVSNFNKDKYAIVCNDNKCGIINSKGKEVVPLSYDEIEELDENLYSLLSEKYDKKLFIYKDSNEKYGIISVDNKIVIKAIYDEIEYITNDYPIIIAKYLNDKLLINLSTGKELSIKIKDSEIDINDNYIVVGNEYYNYLGKLIYKVK